MYGHIQWEIAVEYWSAAQCLHESTKRMNQNDDSSPGLYEAVLAVFACVRSEPNSNREIAPEIMKFVNFFFWRELSYFDVMMCESRLVDHDVAHSSVSQCNRLLWYNSVLAFK